MPRRSPSSSATIDQHTIAQRLNLAQSTVSRALNGDEQVSEKTRERVFSAARSLGYTPNFVARSLVMQRTLNVGVILVTTDYHFYAIAAIAAQQVLLQAGYSTTLCVTDAKLDREIQYLRFLIERQVDGLIVISSTRQTGVAHLNQFRPSCPAMVVVNRYHDDRSLDTVMLGDVQSGCLATQHLIDLGHRYIGLVALANASPATLGIVSGYRQVLDENGIAFRSEQVVPTTGDVEGGVSAAIVLLECVPRPTAIITVNDAQAAGVVQAVQRHGLRVPDDVAVIGHDDTVGAAYVVPPLTTIRMPWAEAGTRSAELVLARINAPNRRPVSEDLTCTLVFRGSCPANPLAH